MTAIENIYVQLPDEPKKGKVRNPTDRKIAGVGSWAFAGLKVFFALLLKPLTLVFSFYKKLREVCGFSVRRHLKDDYAVNFQKQFKFDYTNSTLPHYDEELHDFEKKVENFSKEMSKLAKDPDKIRKKIVELSNHPAYLRLKASDHPAIQFLQECGERLGSTNGVESFAKYGHAKLSKHIPVGDGPLSLSEFAIGLGSARSDKTTHRDGTIATLAWGAMHPEKVAHVAYAHLDPLHYDSYQNHTVFLSKNLEDEGHSIIHQYTPGLTGPTSIVEHVLIPAYRKQGRRWVHIDNQSTHDPYERERVNEIHQWAEANPDVFLHAVIATDTPTKLAKEKIDLFVNDKIHTVADFIADYELLIRGDQNRYIRNYEETRGIYIPDELLSDEELDAAYTAARNMILNNPEMNQGLLSSRKGRKELVRIIERNFSSVLSWAIIKKEQLSHENSIFTENCKENIDRGPMENMGVVINDQLSQGVTTISRDIADLQAGITLGRADYTMDRSPQADRYKPFLDRMLYIDATRNVAIQELQNLRCELSKGPGAEEIENLAQHLEP